MTLPTLYFSRPGPCLDHAVPPPTLVHALAHIKVLQRDLFSNSLPGNTSPCIFSVYLDLRARTNISLVYTHQSTALARLPGNVMHVCTLYHIYSVLLAWPTSQVQAHDKPWLVSQPRPLICIWLQPQVNKLFELVEHLKHHVSTTT